MPDNATACPQQARSEQAVPVHLQRDKRQQSRQNEQLCRHHRTSLRPPQAACAPSAAPLMKPLLQPSAHFPHRMIQDPRGFLLGRFSNAGRRRAIAQRSDATRIRKPLPHRSFVCGVALSATEQAQRPGRHSAAGRDHARCCDAASPNQPSEHSAACPASPAYAVGVFRRAWCPQRSLPLEFRATGICAP
jgi:hypothetical protein